MLRCGRALPLALLLGAALGACGLDAVGSGSIDGGARDGGSDVARGPDLDAGDGGGGPSLDGEASVTCAVCPSGFTCTSGDCTDSAREHFTLAANPSGNWTWAYHLALAPVADVVRYALPHTETAQGGIQAWSRDPGSVTPAVFFNPSAAVVHPYGTFTMQPGELAFHPGAFNENSVVRWTAPQARVYSAAISVRGLSGYMGAPLTTTGITVLEGTAVLGTTVLDADVTSSNIAVSARPFAAGETLDVRVDFGSNGNYGYDSTGIDVLITAP